MLKKYAEKQYYPIEECEGGVKSKLPDILQNTMGKILKLVKYDSPDEPVLVEVAVGFDGAGSYTTFSNGQDVDAECRNQIFGNCIFLILRILSIFSLFCDLECKADHVI